MQKINLFCLPFAGGSKYSYNDFVHDPPPAVNFIPLDLPGRGARVREGHLRDIGLMTDDVYRQIRSYGNMPYAIFGHSMGALLGYLTTIKISKENHDPPIHLFCSGMQAPSTRKKSSDHLLSNDELIKKISALGGMPPEFLSNKYLIDFFVPILRSDFTAIDTYTYEWAGKQFFPLTVFSGTEEKFSNSDLFAWQQETEMPIEVRRFSGNHFFLFEHKAELMHIINDRLRLTAPTMLRTKHQ
jgi:surfactin synthase thioesterase subunit